MPASLTTRRFLGPEAACSTVESMFGLLSRVVVVFVAGGWSARAYARDFVRAYIRRLVRDRLLTGLILTVSQLGLLAATAFCVPRFGNPLAGRLLGSALVW